MKVISRNWALCAVFFVIALFFFSSCTGKTKDAPLSGFEQAFADAGLRLLRETVSSRDFSLPIVFPAMTAASQPGETQTLSDLKGKVVFLNFWATWCGPCRDEMPSMEVLYRRFKDKGLEIMAVNCQEEQEEVLDFMANNGLTFPALLDGDGRVSGTDGIQAIPTTFLIDRDGRIILRLVGSINWDTEKIHAAIESLLNSA
jgi:thiol-disulfide isomerase/thioredoxin